MRTAEDVRALRTDRAGDLAYVARAIEKVAAHFRDRLGIIGFCGAPFTLASYMIEGGGSRNYIHTKQMMYGDPLAWRSLLDKLVVVLTEYCRLQVQAGRRRHPDFRLAGLARSPSPTTATTPLKPPSGWCAPCRLWACP